MPKIDGKELTVENVGNWVRYETEHEKEEGRIKGWNHPWVYVVFDCAGNWDKFMNHTPEACATRDLTFIEGDDMDA